MSQMCNLWKIQPGLSSQVCPAWYYSELYSLLLRPPVQKEKKKLQTCWVACSAHLHSWSGQGSFQSMT